MNLAEGDFSSDDVILRARAAGIELDAGEVATIARTMQSSLAALARFEALAGTWGEPARFHVQSGNA